MTRKIRRHTFKYPHLRQSLEVWYSKTLTIAEMDGYLSQKYPETATMEIVDTVDIAALTVAPTSESPIVMLLNNKSSISDVHHETIHVTMHFFHVMGQTHNIENDEFFAYTSTSIFEDIFNVITKRFGGTLKLTN